VVDDITNRELAGRLEDLRAAIRDYVGRLEYAAYQADLEHRLTALAELHHREITDIRDDIRQLNARLDDADKAAREHRLSFRTVIYTGLLPAVVVLLGIVVQIILARSGGH
jgi:hypothetical protein